MKIRADEHVSPKIVRAIQLLVLSGGWDLSHVRDHHSARTADETWIPRFAVEGGKAILTADRKMLARPHQLAAIVAAGLVCIFLPAKWATAKRNVQAASALFWWPKIEKCLASSKPAQCWRVPFDFVEGELEELLVRAPAGAAASGRRGQ